MRFFYFFIFFGLNLSSAQNTVGLLLYNQDASDGYTLFGSQQGFEFSLINNCGEEVNKWTSAYKLGVGYILPNGNLLKSGQNRIELRDWDNNLLWDVDLNAFGISQHHDIEPLPNGNILVLSRDVYNSTDAINSGRDPSLFSVATSITLEKIIEIEPVGVNSLNIIWEWKFWDHLIQDFNSSKANYGDVGSSPGLLDFNYVTNSNTDWIHANAIEYNASLDQIMICSRNTNEIYIVDHNSTTAEASGHTGGARGKGGDFLWRYGNPIVYKQGLAADKVLFGPHDPKWIPAGYPNEGKISIFNNGTARLPSPYTSVHIIDSFVDVSGDYSMTSGLFNGVFHWSWDGSVLGDLVFSPSRGGANLQPNGNMLFCEATTGQISEVTNAGQVVWSYKNPKHPIAIYNQGDLVTGTTNAVFRAEKYPNNYSGFVGKDLTPTGIIENVNTLLNPCKVLSIEDVIPVKAGVVIYPNPVADFITIKSIDLIKKIEVFNINGKIVMELNTFSVNHSLKDFSAGLYFIKITSEKGSVVKKIIKE